MKKILFICGLIVCLLSFPSPTFGSEYNSNGVTSFYGTYEEPKEEPDRETTVGKKQVNNSGKNILLATGSNHQNQQQKLGFSLLLIGLIIIHLRREKNEKNSIDSSRYYLRK